MSKIAESCVRSIDGEYIQKTDSWSPINYVPSLVPIMGICYMLQFLDKGALAHSTLLGLLSPISGIVSLASYVQGYIMKK